MSIKTFKAGTVQMKKSGDGRTIKLGNYSKNSKFATTTQVIIRDSEGKVLADVTDGYLVLKNPRERTNKDGSPLNEDQVARIPDYILSEMYVVVNDEKN